MDIRVYEYEWSKYTKQKRDCQSGSEKQDPTICYVQETHFKYKDTDYILKYSLK